jgi:hypothetical protein
VSSERQAFIWKYGVRWGIPMFFLFVVDGVVVPYFYGTPITAWRLVFATIAAQ